MLCDRIRPGETALTRIPLVVAVDSDARALEDGFGAKGCILWPGDLACDDAEQLANDIWQRHGPIQLLVNNVGIATPRRFLELSQDEFNLVFNTNLLRARRVGPRCRVRFHGQHR
jgi:NAD(P)-dependent dehydrogenase (short-subunit alcohol dehydrogenase family)